MPSASFPVAGFQISTFTMINSVLYAVDSVTADSSLFSATPGILIDPFVSPASFET